MKLFNIFYIVPLLMLLSAQSFANSTYVGIEYQIGQGKHKFSGHTSESVNIDTSTIGIKFGHAFSNESRIEGGISFSSYDGESGKSFDMDIKGVEFDYLFVKNNKKVLPYISLGLELDNWDYDKEYFGKLSENSIMGLGFRLGAGLIFRLNSSFEISTGIMHKIIKWKDIEGEIDRGMLMPYTYTIKQKTNQTHFKLGLNYRF